MLKETREGLKIMDDVDGQEFLFINSDRLSDCIDYLHENDLRYVAITFVHGFKGKDLSFLLELKDFLEGLIILDSHYDLSSVNELHKLKYIAVHDNGKDIVDFNNFPDLEICTYTYSKRFLGLESCKNMKMLGINKFKSKKKDLSILHSFQKLEELSIMIADITNLNGIERYKSLKKLFLYGARNLETLKPLNELKENIEVVEIYNCKKISDFEVLGELKLLNKIILMDSGRIESLAFIQGLPNLKFLSFGGTIVTDGNLSYCEGIEMVGFDNKRHYSHRVEQFMK